MSEIILPSTVTNVDGLDQAVNLITNELLSARTIYLFGEVDDAAAINVITQLKLLKDRSDEEIFLYINSPGGSVTSGLAIYDVMQEVKRKCDLCTVCVGLGASMGAVLLAGGTKGKRYASPSAEIMIHQPMGGAQGQAADISLMAEHIQLVRKKLGAILSADCDRTLRAVLRDMDRDNWKTAGEAVDYGLVDHVGFPDRDKEAEYE